MKKCSRCDTEKPTSEYHKDRGNKDGLYSYCKPCARAKTAAWKAADPERSRESQRRSRRKRPHVYWEKNLRMAFGINIEQYQKMFDEQNGCCAVCGETETEIHPRSGRLRRLAVDHCHKTGKVRGLLCNNCNRAIGLLKDDPTVLRSAINYLEK
jgi:hypothetical protein